jgi:hypothetical protein
LAGEIGDLLIMAKERAGHGQWLGWLEQLPLPLAELAPCDAHL